SGIGADPQATDMARVLRTPGSFNTKNNSVVQVLRSEDIVYAMRYLQEFMNDNIGYNQKEIDKRNKENRKNKQKSTKTQRKLSYLFNFYTLAIARANDIRKLCELRNYKVVGFRNTIIRSEEHTSELQSRFDLVCRLLLEKKNTTFQTIK